MMDNVNNEYNTEDYMIEVYKSIRESSLNYSPKLRRFGSRITEVNPWIEDYVISLEDLIKSAKSVFYNSYTTLTSTRNCIPIAKDVSLNPDYSYTPYDQLTSHDFHYNELFDYDDVDDRIYYSIKHMMLPSTRFSWNILIYRIFKELTDLNIHIGDHIINMRRYASICINDGKHQVCICNQGNYYSIGFDKDHKYLGRNKSTEITDYIKMISNKINL